MYRRTETSSKVSRNTKEREDWWTVKHRRSKKLIDCEHGPDTNEEEQTLGSHRGRQREMGLLGRQTLDKTGVGVVAASRPPTSLEGEHEEQMSTDI